MAFFKPLYRQLKNDSVPPEMKAGLWMIIEATLQRNYLSAYDIYMHLAIGEMPCIRWLPDLSAASDRQ